MSTMVMTAFSKSVGSQYVIDSLSEPLKEVIQILDAGPDLAETTTDSNGGKVDSSEELNDADRAMLTN